jgi:hypothetical protein
VNKNIYTEYTLDKKPYNKAVYRSTDSAAVFLFDITNKKLATSIYNSIYNKPFNYNIGYWGHKNDYFSQNWSWLVSAFYFNKLPNIWNNK